MSIDSLNALERWLDDEVSVGSRIPYGPEEMREALSVIASYRHHPGLISSYHLCIRVGAAAMVNALHS